MSIAYNSINRSSEETTDTSKIRASEIVADELYSLLDPGDNESIANEFRTSVYSNKHDFKNYVKVAVPKGLDPSSSLTELIDKTAVDDSLEHMPKSQFSELTNDHEYTRSFASCSR